MNYGLASDFNDTIHNVRVFLNLVDNLLEKSR